MKFTVAAVAAFAAVAVAAPSPEADPWCHRVGFGCWKVKRAAEAFADAIGSSHGLEERSPEAEFSNLPGGASNKAKRAVDELANVLALSSDKPDEYYNKLGLDKVDEGHEKREAAPEPWCHRVGFGCWKRDTTDDSPADKDKRWCHRVGFGCWKAKRAATAVLEAIGGDDKHEPRWCTREGGCWKAKRDLHAIKAVARSILEEV